VPECIQELPPGVAGPIREASYREDVLEFRTLVGEALAEYPNCVEAVVLQGIVDKVKGLKPETEAALARARELDVNNPLTLAFAANLAATDARTEEGACLARKALATGSRNRWVLLWASDALGVARDYARSLEVQERWRELYPDDPDALMSLVLTQQNLGHAAAADALRQQALALFPEAPPVARDRARRLALAGKLSEAVEVMQDAVERTPNASYAWGQLALLLSNAHRHDGARHAVERALELAPACSTALSAMVSVCRHEGKEEEAESWQERVYEGAPFLRLQACLKRGNAAMREGRWEDALVAADEAIQSGSATTVRGGLQTRIDALLYLERPEQAEEAWQRIMPLWPDSPRLHEWGGHIREQQGDDAAARAFYQEGLARHPNAGAIRAYLVRLLLKLDDQEALAETIAEALLYPPDTPWGFRDLCIALDDADAGDVVDELVRLGRERFPDTAELKLIESVRRLAKRDLKGARELAAGTRGAWAEVGAQLVRAANSMERGEAALQHQDWRALAAVLEQQAEEFPDTADTALAAQALAQIMEAQALLNDGQVEAAAALAERIVATGVRRAGLSALQGRIALARGDDAQAETIAREGLAEFPDSGALRVLLLDVLLARDAAADLRAFAADAVAHPPAEPWALALLYTMLRDYGEARPAEHLRERAEASFPETEARAYFSAFDAIEAIQTGVARERLQAVEGAWQPVAQRVELELDAHERLAASVNFWAAKAAEVPEATTVVDPSAHDDRHRACRFWERKR